MKVALEVLLQCFYVGSVLEKCFLSFRGVIAHLFTGRKVCQILMVG